jgi:hypothetical protein
MSGKITHKVYQVLDRGEDKKSFWCELGVGFENRDGSINLILNATPVDGKVQVRRLEQQPKKEE